MTREKRETALALKLVATAVGLVGLTIALVFLYDGINASGSTGLSAPAVIIMMAAFSAAVSSAYLLASLPESVRARFKRRPRMAPTQPIYGFVTLLAVGVGATLGSPLFVLIPLNILQYEFVSIGSLLLATILSVLMARLYGRMYTRARGEADAVGGPSFARMAYGTRSVRYFISRVSMWIANTALAAYSKIVFLIFDFEVLPPILTSYGVGGLESTVFVWGLAAAFISWSVTNAIFENRMLKAVGYLQIVLTGAMVVILVYQSLLLGSVGSWNLTGLLHFPQGNWVFALVVNTGYLYLLFFGFQEIQAVERDAKPQVSVPLISRLKPGFTMKRKDYLNAAMIISVVVAAAVNILYAAAVFSVHPSLSEVEASSIPALFLAKAYLGTPQELLTAVAFLLATVTTFVPAFLAASRHLSALGEDGYIPQSVSGVSWVFTLGSILILAVSNGNFLVEITDFLVLISLGVICLSPLRLERFSVERTRVLPWVVGLSCFLAALGVYFLSPSVAIFGLAALAIAYLVFDVTELGVLGTQLFLAVFDVVCVIMLAFFTGGLGLSGPALSEIGLGGETSLVVLAYVLLTAAGMLLLNLFVDVRLLGRASRMRT